MSDKKYALFSISNKQAPHFKRLVHVAHETGYTLLSSRGTFTHIKDVLGLPVVDVEEVTKFPPILGHRVVTLDPRIHGGLLADRNTQMEELVRLDLPYIDMLVCTFYPLAQTIADHGEDFDKVTESIDIGGPAMIRSACKGDRIVIASEDLFEDLADRLVAKTVNHARRRIYQAYSANVVASYVALEAEYRSRWVP